MVGKEYLRIVRTKQLFFLVVFLISILPLFGTDGFPIVSNKGQWPSQVQFGTDIPGGKMFLEKGGFTYHMFDLSAVSEVHNSGKQPVPGEVRIKGHVYKVKLEGADLDASTNGKEPLERYFNFFLGNDSSKWAGGCRAYKAVEKKNIYPNIDFKLYQNESFLKYDFIVNPGGDAHDIVLRYESSDDVTIENGKLVIKTSIGETWEQKPIAWQIINGNKKYVSCKYVLDGTRVHFEFPSGYDTSSELIIDPELVFSTYSGSYSDNFGYTATYDNDGYLYSGSSAFGQDYPTTTGAYQTNWAGGDGQGNLPGIDIALSKYDVTGTYMVWSTFLGGSHDELPHSLICNDQNELLVYGTTSSQNFPVVGGGDGNVWNGGSVFAPYGVGADYVNGSDIIVTRFNQNCTDLIASRFIGGSSNDGVNTATILKFNYADEFRGEIEIDNNGNVVIVSSTYSINFPVLNAVQSSLAGGQDACVVVLTPDLEDIVWSTYFGGSLDDSGYSVAFNDANEFYFCGGTKSTNLATTNGALNENFVGGTADGFAAKITGNGNDILNCTYFGSTSYDQIYFIETDNDNSPFLYGQTMAANNTFVINAGFSQPNSGMLVTKMNPELDEVVWSTVFGSGEGQPNLSPTAMLVDVCGKIYLSGWGGSTNTSTNGDTENLQGMIVTADAYQSTTNYSDFYLMVLEDDASELVYASYFGGGTSNEHVDGGTSRFDRKGIIYQSVCAGCGGNDDFPIYPSNAVSPINNSTNCNNGVFKFDFQLPITAADFIVSPIACTNAPIQFTSTSTWALTYHYDFGDFTSSTSPNPIHQYASPGEYDVELIVTHPGTCNGADTIVKHITIGLPNVDYLDDAEVCEGNTVEIGPEEIDPNYEYTWVPMLYLSDFTDPNTVFSPGESTDYYLLAEHDGCVDTLYQSVIVTQIMVEVPADTSLCDDEFILLNAIPDPPGSSITWSTNSDFSNPINDGPDDSDIFVSVSVPTTFYVLVQDGGCEVTDEVFVNLLSFQTMIQGDFTACENDTVNLSVLDPNPEFEYEWAPEELIISGQNTSSVSVFVEEQTMFYVYSTAPGGCTASDSVEVDVSVLNIGSISATAEPSIVLEGESSQLAAIPDGYDYNWIPASWLNDATIQNPIATPPVTTLYTVEVVDGDCIYSASVTVKVAEFVCGPPSVYVPNAFTPNKDGHNEKLVVRGNFITDLYFVIYDRWGEKIFETTKQSAGWDGTYKGMEVDPAVYVYYLEAECDGGERYFEKGNITVIK